MKPKIYLKQVKWNDSIKGNESFELFEGTLKELEEDKKDYETHPTMNYTVRYFELKEVIV